MPFPQSGGYRRHVVDHREEENLFHSNEIAIYHLMVVLHDHGITPVWLKIASSVLLVIRIRWHYLQM